MSIFNEKNLFMGDLDDCGLSSGMQGNLRDSICSFSSCSSISHSSSVSIKNALSDCSFAWKNYLSALNNLCSAGSKLALSISVLEQLELAHSRVLSQDNPTFQNHPSTYLTTSWSDLARATTFATNTVKSHIMSLMQDFITFSTLEQISTMCESEQKRIRDHNQRIIMENVHCMVNIQHQFCSASYNAFASLTCCFECQSPVGFPHEKNCMILNKKTILDQRSQTPSPNFGSFKNESPHGNSFVDQRPSLFGSTSCQLLEQINCGIELQPHLGVEVAQNFRDPAPLQAIFENIRGPLPNPGQLLSMKIPFYRSSKSPMYFPLFPLNGQRRWSEAAACEMNEDSMMDVENQMRRWSMPWEAWKTDPNTVTWYHTRIMPVNTCKSSMHKLQGSSNTKDQKWLHSSLPSQDGLSEAIQLLSCKPSKNHQLNLQHSNHYPLESSNVE